MELKELIFKFMDEFFLQEVNHPFHSSSNCQKERWSICQECEHFDELEEGCKACGCYLPHKIKDSWGDCPLDKWISNDEEWNNVHYDQIKQIIIDKYPDYEHIIRQYEIKG
jgi:hypothetical protein